MSDEGALPEPSLELLVTQLAAQALMQLGQAPNPLSGVAEVALARARLTIGLLEVLEHKTRGNLNTQQQRFLVESLARVRDRYNSLSGD